MYDCGFTKENNWFRYRAAAIIIEDGCVLFASNQRDDYFYSIGGGVHMGETAEEAVLREVYEETGVRYEIDYLAVIHENFFNNSIGTLNGMKCHELSFYYMMKSRGTKELNSNSISSYGDKEVMHWVPLEELDKVKAFPRFLKDYLSREHIGVEHIVTDERIEKQIPDDWKRLYTATKNVIRTERLELVEFDQKYATDLYKLWGDFEVIKYTYMPQLHSAQQCAEKINMFIENTDKDVQNNFIILKDNRAIGIIGSPIIDKAHAEFGLYYQIVRKYWGNGYTSEALLAFKKHIINQFPDAKFHVEVVSENGASIAILKKAGFVEETVLQDGFTLNGFKLDLLKFGNCSEL